ncbi:MAG: hypothetical protein VYA60_05130 [Pseudomonadota bacterium]|nr:hypothetical protein [Pseudomonadota bacterium]|tara:strand:+ start:222 stop:479 length:258 start_codon:yes stop_codon:yes gene_type:complete
MKYEITKIDVATNQAIGRTKSFATAKELLSELSDRNNGWLEGKGSIIEKNGVEIFNTKDYLRLDETNPSIKKILERKKQYKEEGY